MGTVKVLYRLNSVAARHYIWIQFANSLDAFFLAHMVNHAGTFAAAGLSRAGELLRGASGKPLKRFHLPALVSNTPMNGGVNETETSGSLTPGSVT